MKNKIINELRSFFTTFIAVFVVEAGAILLQIYDGVWTQVVFVSLGMAVARSVVKSILILLFPQLFKA